MDSMCQHVQEEAGRNPRRLVQIDSHPDWGGDPVEFEHEFDGELAPPPNPFGPFKPAIYGVSIVALAVIFGTFIRLCYIASH